MVDLAIDTPCDQWQETLPKVDELVAHAVNALGSHDLVFGVGPAGTGKTYLAVAVGVAMLMRGDFRLTDRQARLKPRCQLFQNRMRLLHIAAAALKRQLIAFRHNIHIERLFNHRKMPVMAAAKFSQVFDLAHFVLESVLGAPFSPARSGCVQGFAPSGCLSTQAFSYLPLCYASWAAAFASDPSMPS